MINFLNKVTASSKAVSDPYFPNVTTLISANATNGTNNNTFKDTSPNNATITATGTVTQGSNSPWGNNWSSYFGTTVATAGDSLNIPTAGSCAFGTGDFTIEAYINFNTWATTKSIIKVADGASTTGTALCLSTSNFLTFYVQGTVILTGTTALGMCKWYHVAVTRQSGVLNLWVNGVLDASVANVQSMADAGIVIGSNGTNAFRGYISNVRIVNGTAVYTTNFTPSIFPLTNITNTKVLACNSNNGMKENGPFQYTTTSGGTLRQSHYSPFSGDYSYGSVNIIAGASYLSTVIPAFGSSDFTVEGWFNITAGSYGIFSIGAANFGAGLSLRVYGGGVAINGGTTVLGTVKTLSWYHFAMVRISGTMYVYLNGVQLTSVADATYYTAQALVYGGYLSTANTFQGHLAGFRITTTAVYTGNFTPPTTPPISITGTIFLQNATNAGLVDLTRIHNWSTIGNTQVTSSSKYGTGAIKLDVTGSYMQAPIVTPMAFFNSSAYWTIEMWVCRTGTTTSTNAIGVGDYQSTFAWGLGIDANNFARLHWFYTATNYVCQGTTYLALGQWYHIAGVMVAGVGTLYVNGVKEGSNISLVSIQPSNNYLTIGHNTLACPLLIDDLRITNGIARYSYNYTPDINPNISLDPVGNYNMLTLTGENVVGNNATFVDSSTNNVTVSRVGTATQGSFNPYYPNWSVYFGTGNDYLTVTSSTVFAVGAGDFTIECWFKISTLGAYKTIWRTSNGTTIYITPTNTVVVYINNSLVLSGVNILNTNNWNHVAVTRQSGTLKIFLNGVLDISVANSTVQAAHTNCVIGTDTAYYFKGSISNLRIVVGTAVYTTNFSVPTSNLTAISGTTLLTCQSNRFIDNSSNNYTVVCTATPIVVPQSPFNKLDYSPSTYGGSMYFYGATDYLTLPSSSNYSMGTGDFTIECWVYYTIFAASSGYIFQLSSASTGANTGTHIGVMANSTGVVYIDLVSSQVSTGVTTSANQWNHFAIVRSSGTTKLYMNGVSIYSVADATNYTTTYCSVGTGWSPTSPINNGYISNFRIVKGTAIYTTNFTPPTSPVPAVSGTQLLLNGTNGSIIDSSMTCDISVVGTATMSSSIFKYGTMSMYFPGTAGNYMVIPDNPAHKVGLSDFTIECWVYRSAIGVQHTIINKMSGGTGYNFYINISNQLVFAWTGAGVLTGTTATVSGTTWTHVAATRVGGILRLFLNGNQLIEGACATDLSSTQPLYIGTDNTNYFNGYIDDLRFTIGESQHRFTPPTELPTS